MHMHIPLPRKFLKAGQSSKVGSLRQTEFAEEPTRQTKNDTGHRCHRLCRKHSKKWNLHRTPQTVSRQVRVQRWETGPLGDRAPDSARQGQSEGSMVDMHIDTYIHRYRYIYISHTHICMQTYTYVMGVVQGALCYPQPRNEGFGIMESTGLGLGCAGLCLGFAGLEGFHILAIKILKITFAVFSSRKAFFNKKNAKKTLKIIRDTSAGARFTGRFLR